ncbi:MAG: hypothetical protein K0R18_1675 [Bacillales bacterium]|jgi:hypothetical protein|nr:hypothetical protein [Bacillales bacterium]
MRKRIELTGKFGRLTIIKFSHIGSSGHVYWSCKCDCGNKLSVRGCHLVNGDTMSCGCLHDELKLKHGKYGTKIYFAWAQMIQRCNNPKNEAYPNYGGREIKVCNEWLSFEKFYEDMGDRPNGMTLDRKDNDRGYFKENCRWATKEEQENNKRTNKIITFNGKTLSLKQWSYEVNINYNTLTKRLNKGWSIEDTLTRKVQVQNHG